MLIITKLNFKKIPKKLLNNNIDFIELDNNRLKNLLKIYKQTPRYLSFEYNRIIKIPNINKLINFQHLYIKRNKILYKIIRNKDIEIVINSNYNNKKYKFIHINKNQLIFI